MPTQNELEAAAADPDAGWLAAGICRGCHELEPGEELYATYPGPTLLGIVGRPKASIETFEYSEAMRAQEGVWTLEELNQFLGDVYGTVPGTRMYNFPPDMTKEERTGVLSILLTLRAE